MLERASVVGRSSSRTRACGGRSGGAISRRRWRSCGRRGPSRPTPGLVLAGDDRRLAAAAERVLARLPGDSRCLTRSLVVLTMLARRGIEVRLVLAARPTPTFAAHAWVERAGHPLLPTRGFGDARLTEL